MSKGMIVFGVASMILFANAPVNAEEVVAKKPVDVPTLDWLHGQDEKYPQSVYTITPSDESDYDFVYKDAISGQETYYKIVLKNFSSDSVIWTNVTSEIKDNTIPDDRSIVAVKLPSGTQYLEYKLQEGATLQLHKSDLRSVAVDGIVSGAFIELNGSEDGGAIHNEDKDNSAVDIKADFVKNHSSHSGGAIYNSKMNAKIGDIKGNFIGNYVKSESGDAKGGAINNESATIGNITGDFIGNYAQGHSYANGGAIYNSKMNAKIGNITGDFIGNYAQGHYYANGGAIYNGSKIGNIEGDFTRNYASSSNSYVYGGAIYNNWSAEIGNITGDFIGNYASSSNSYASGGAIFNYEGTIGDITGDFSGNYVKSKDDYASGGAIFNYKGTIGDITGDFTGNYAQGHSHAYGGAIYNNGANAKIGNIEGDFIGNYAQGNYARGGAIFNYKGTIGDITGDFTGNYAQGHSHAYGGAIYNGYNGIIGDIKGDFAGNYAQGHSYAVGGVIYNLNGIIGDIKGDFAGNYAQGHSYAVGGAIYNSKANIGNITGDFSDNYASSSNSSADGGAIFNYEGTIGDITGDFIGNYAQGNYADGGAIYNGYNGIIGDITGDFSDNYASSSNFSADGGAIYNNQSAEIGNITGDFSGNYAQGNYAYGGAIYNERGTIGDITGDFRGNYAQGNYAYGGAIFNYKSKMNSIINSNFIDNYVSGNEESKGGAIYSGGSDLQITADGKTSLFSGNKVNDKSNAIYMESVVEENYSNRTYTVPAVNLNLTAVNNGVITFDDGIDGGFVISDCYKDYQLEGEIETYNINIDSDGTGVVQFNNLVENVTNFNVSADAKVHLGVNADIQTKNMSVLGSMSRMARSEFSPLITVDVSVNKAENRVDSGKIHVDGDIVGNYRILVNALNADVLDNLNDAIVPFLIAENDNKNTESSFIIAHVLGTPYMWDGGINVKGEEQGSTWYLNLTEEVNPDYVPPVEEPDEGDDNKDDDKPNTGDDNNGDDDKPATGDDDKPTKPAKPVENKPVYAEVMAGVGLHEAALEQTRSVTRHVSDQVACPRRYCSECGGDEHKFTDLCQRSWVIVQGENATMNSPVKADAKIWGMEAGFDVQRDDHNKLGVFVSYRKGDYDLSGQGKRLHSKDGSEIDITSYLAGLYYRYAKNQDWLFATIYGGKQDAEVTTHDGLGVFDTDGVELGASVEAGRTYALTDTWSLTPSVGFKYTQIDFDGANDNVSKTYKWDTVKQLEAEAGAKLEKQVENSRFYIKPSVIRTFTSGDSVNITGLRDVDTYHDQTLGRLEVGADVELTEKLAVTGWVNHTVGSDYHATAYGVGLKYTW